MDSPTSPDAAASAVGRSWTPDPAPAWRRVVARLGERIAQGGSHVGAGGSGNVREHQARVAAVTRDLAEGVLSLRAPTPARRPAAAGRLDQALARGRRGPEAPAIRAIEPLARALVWREGYMRPPAGLHGRFAQCEVAAPGGPVQCRDMRLGLILFAPGCVYPAHAHPGIEESYVCLAGAVSQNEAGLLTPGALILNRPDRVHRLRAETGGPSLLAYAWLGPAPRLARAATRFVRATPRRRRDGA